MSLVAAELQAVLHETRERYGVVGASLAVLIGNSLQSCASGLLNLNTGVECTTDSVFQIGSISKVFTATLVMQLVDRGLLSLNDPVIKYLSNFTLADATAARTVTVRQLLNHTSGIDGDFFPADDPEGPSTDSYVRKMCLLPSLYLPGEGPVTYCNSGFVVAGRIVEVLTGMTWQRAVMEHICKPLGLSAAFAQPHESLRFRCAMGHVRDPQKPGGMVLSPTPYLPISMAPAGSVLTMSAGALLRFAAAHMANGEYAGARILSTGSARRMREDTVEVPPFGKPGVTHVGLGWFVGQQDRFCVVRHDGGTQGQMSYLRTFPGTGVAFTLLTDSPSEELFGEIERHLVKTLLGASVCEYPPPETVELLALDHYVGCYRNILGSFEVRSEGQRLRLRVIPAETGAATVDALLEPYRRDVFQIRAPGNFLDGQKASFIGETTGGGALYIRLASRMARACVADPCG